MRLGGKLVLAMAAALTLCAASATSAAAQQVYDVDQLTDKPRIASPMEAQRAIEKAYPRMLQDRGIDGKVTLQFVLLQTGKVDPGSIVVQNAEHDSLADAAKKAIAGIEFVPGAVDGSPVATRVIFPIEFVAR